MRNLSDYITYQKLTSCTEINSSAKEGAGSGNPKSRRFSGVFPASSFIDAVKVGDLCCIAFSSAEKKGPIGYSNWFTICM